ncbi:unnamed protein product [Lepeophtheirus salmonis]|uniref:(salmon louse) hypothetical protein n=1 Tax=Lepeophtheirus salmonis TaxID=72036 RepID=A0A7R8CQQ0_LEPSM|nr:unnamed protein product [Lepeophtheirus salmonis]CAF2895483.1 unnamed protein product [Lepeophtheirus salmonis]
MVYAHKHGSVAGQALDCILRLVVPEYNHKPRNYPNEFLLYLKNNEVKKNYSEQVIQTVVKCPHNISANIVLYAIFVMPEMRIGLGRQRRDYSLSDEFPTQYPVQEQARNIHDTPVTNISMDSNCGQVDYRLHNLKQLEAETTKKRELKMMTWSEKMKERFRNGATEKEALAIEKDSKGLMLLEKLKEGDLFTKIGEIRTVQSLRTQLNASDDPDLVSERVLRLTGPFSPCLNLLGYLNISREYYQQDSHNTNRAS